MGEWLNMPNMFRVDPDKVVQYRRELMLTQREVADRAGVDFDTVRAMEGTGHVSKHGHQTNTIKRVAMALMVQPTDLLAPKWQDVIESGGASSVVSSTGD